MAIHFIPIGIEANSRDEAEQKLLQIQQIVTEYKTDSNPNDKEQQADNSSLSKDVFRAIMQIGLLWVAQKTQRVEGPPKKSVVIPAYERRKYRRNKQQQTKK